MENRVSEDFCSDQPNVVSILVSVSNIVLVLSGLIMFRTISLPYKNADTIQYRRCASFNGPLTESPSRASASWRWIRGTTRPAR